MLAKHTLWLANVVLGTGHLGCAFGVFLVLVVNDGGWQTPVVLTYNTWVRREDDTFRITQGEEELTAAFYPGYVLLFCSVFSGLHHVVAARDAGYYTAVQGGFSGYRWIDYALSAPLMLVVNELLWLAPPDINTLVLIAAVQMLIVIAGGAAAEWWWATAVAPPGWSTDRWVAIAFASATAPFLWIWARYAWILQLGSASGEESVPDFVFVFLALLFVSFCSFPFVLGAKLWGAPTDTARNVRFEVRFMLLSALAKIPLLSFFATGLVARRTRATATDNSLPSDEDTATGLYAVGIATAAVVFATAAVIAKDPAPASLRTACTPYTLPPPSPVYVAVRKP
ncbi:hypothetical protein [Nereida ignava]|uniref:hypothetical protein n=1 Tax=Nereida ignava TaxID=282199 RepID=UPI0030F6BEDD